jgi:hypothetical protein
VVAVACKDMVVPLAFKTKRIEWSESKNQELVRTRDISFQDVLLAIEDEDCVLDWHPHPNSSAYPNQMFLVVRIRDYICAVPCVEDLEKIFLKTIYKSRKLYKKYAPTI